MALIKPTKILKNEADILETADILIHLRNKLEVLYPDEDQERILWALEQSIMRLSLNTGHDFGIPV